MAGDIEQHGFHASSLGGIDDAAIRITPSVAGRPGGHQARALGVRATQVRRRRGNEARRFAKARLRPFRRCEIAPCQVSRAPTSRVECVHEANDYNQGSGRNRFHWRALTDDRSHYFQAVTQLHNRRLTVSLTGDQDTRICTVSREFSARATVEGALRLTSRRGD